MTPGYHYTAERERPAGRGYAPRLRDDTVNGKSVAVLTCLCWEFEHGGTCDHIAKRVAIQERKGEAEASARHRKAAKADSIAVKLAEIERARAEKAFLHSRGFDEIELDISAELTVRATKLAEPTETASQTPQNARTVAELKKLCTARGIGGSWTVRAKRAEILAILSSGRKPTAKADF
jgi:hypothetical protein